MSLVFPPFRKDHLNPMYYEENSLVMGVVSEQTHPRIKRHISQPELVGAVKRGSINGNSALARRYLVTEPDTAALFNAQGQEVSRES
jgi:hypothetical protein